MLAEGLLENKRLDALSFLREGFRSLPKKARYQRDVQRKTPTVVEIDSTEPKTIAARSIKVDCVYQLG